ncbi:MAG: 50S ribosomal protein L19 [Firmicutes bacterium]|nr:50S ribosomal protein L19 [Bacillota bacterium]
MNNLLNEFVKDSTRKEPLKFNVGDTVSVDVAIVEGEKKRVQVFEGVVIAKKSSGISETFTVRKISYGVGVEKVFPLNSPNLKGVKVITSGKIRRGKLYYIRKRVGKEAKIKPVIR